MFVLLPETERKKLLHEYRMRLAIVAVSVFSICAFIAIGLLLPSYFLVRGEHSRLESEKQMALKAIASKSDADLSGVLSEINKNVKILGEVEKDPLEVIEAVLRQKPENVRIKDMKYDYDSKNSKFMLSGTALSRKSLLLFSSNLSKESMFSKVDLPISNLAKETDVPFAITLIGKF